jgi:hypothetical protein
MFKKTLLAALILSSTTVYATKPVLPDILKPTKHMHQHTIENNKFVRKGPTIQVAILLDTSGSMDGLIKQAKSKIWNIINELSKANKSNEDITLQVGLFEYGKQSISKHEGFLQMLLPLSNDLDLLSEKLFALKTNGGDEFAGKVILESINRMQWSDHKDDLKLIIIAGNESFEQGDIPVEFSINKALDNNIIVNTVFCGNYDNGINLGWKKAAEKSGGKYLNIKQNNQIIRIITPYDDQIIILGNKLNNTYIGYGSQGKIKKERQKTQDSNAIMESKAMMADRSISKASKQYKNDSWDITSVYENDEDAGIKVAKEQSEHFKNMSNKDIKAEIEIKAKERINIKGKISSLEKKRTDYINKNKKKDANDFGSVLLKNVKEQAINKGFIFKK